MELKQEYIEFKDYLLSLDKAEAKDEDTIIYNFGKKIGKIAFYYPYLELTVEEDGNNIFLLQTEMVSKTQIDEYMKTFFDCLESKEDRVNLVNKSFNNSRVLFVCSCGVFSSMFAKQCQDKARQLNIPIMYSACSVDKISEFEKDFDRIYFLPQVSYILRRQEFPFKDKIKVLPTAFVAHNDIDSILSYTLPNKS